MCLCTASAIGKTKLVQKAKTAENVICKKNVHLYALEKKKGEKKEKKKKDRWKRDE